MCKWEASWQTGRKYDRGAQRRPSSWLWTKKNGPDESKLRRAKKNPIRLWIFTIKLEEWRKRHRLLRLPPFDIWDCARVVHLVWWRRSGIYFSKPCITSPLSRDRATCMFQAHQFASHWMDNYYSRLSTGLERRLRGKLICLVCRPWRSCVTINSDQLVTMGCCSRARKKIIEWGRDPVFFKMNVCNNWGKAVSMFSCLLTFPEVPRFFHDL